MDKDLYDYIFRRKSIRKYEMIPLKDELLNEIEEFSNTIMPLYPDIKVRFKFVNHVKGVFSVKAPHYMLIFSEDKTGYLTNIGFMFQQVSLFLASKSIGACWLGMARPAEEINSELNFVIAIAFGNPEEVLYRELAQFKRKQLSEISSGADDRLSSAQIAPSAVNSQNWFFACEQGKIHCYLKKLNAVQAMVYENMNKIDIGIAVAHLFVATKHFKDEFIFGVDENAKYIKGYNYIGTVG